MTYVMNTVSMIWVTEVTMVIFVNLGPLAVAVSVLVAMFTPAQRVLGAGVLRVLVSEHESKMTNNVYKTNIVCTTV